MRFWPWKRRKPTRFVVTDFRVVKPVTYPCATPWANESDKPDHWAQYPVDQRLDAAIRSGAMVVHQEDVEVEYVNMPTDFDAAFHEFNRRVNEGDLDDAVVTDARRPDDPRDETQ